MRGCAALSNFIHHGMIFIPPGYALGELSGAHLLCNQSPVPCSSSMPANRELCADCHMRIPFAVLSSLSPFKAEATAQYFVVHDVHAACNTRQCTPLLCSRLSSDSHKKLDCGQVRSCTVWMRCVAGPPGGPAPSPAATALASPRRLS